ncbi:MAG: trypsin-like peptidase domain-containing protein [Ktedonobacteraceae bacterium]
MGQALQLRELLKLCTVRLLVTGWSLGTGFFVAPGLILTCAHVVQSAKKNNLAVKIFTWDGQSLGQGTIEKYVNEELPAKDAITDTRLTNLYPDLALLRVIQNDHPCVYLYDKVNEHDSLFSYGYVEAFPGGDGVEFTYEDQSWIDSQKPLLKFREGQAMPGLSGAPLLNLNTGSVCGIVQRTRGSTGDVGGRAIPVRIILQELPELVNLQKAFHQQHNEWIKALTLQQWQAFGIAPSNTDLDPTQPIEIFYSYAADSKEDKGLLDELLKHLATLRRRKDIANWHAGEVISGQEPVQEVMEHLNAANVILLLISPDYVGSDELAYTQVKRAMERHDAKEAIIIPILLRSIDDWQEEPFGKLQAIPRSGGPVSQWKDRDLALSKVASEIRRAVTALKDGKIRLMPSRSA